jgi:hypothetical protein
LGGLWRVKISTTLCVQLLGTDPSIREPQTSILSAPNLGREMAVNIDLSSSDAWDDSALLKSWNGALKEYKVCSNLACI